VTRRAPRPKRPSPVATRAKPANSVTALRRAHELAGTFKVLSNPNRLKIILFLDERERSVSEIEAKLEIHQPTLSQQLGELRDAGLIHGRKAAKSVFYALTDGPGRRAIETIHLANGHVAPGAVPPPARNPFHQAAVFASVLSTRRSQAGEWQPGFKSLLQE
jgi:ArsR family transcriptional regulator